MSSLFAAYSKPTTATNEDVKQIEYKSDSTTTDSKDKSWLSNSSYKDTTTTTKTTKTTNTSPSSNNERKKASDYFNIKDQDDGDNSISVDNKQIIQSSKKNNKRDSSDKNNKKRHGFLNDSDFSDTSSESSSSSDEYEYLKTKKQKKKEKNKDKKKLKLEKYSETDRSLIIQDVFTKDKGYIEDYIGDSTNISFGLNKSLIPNYNHDQQRVLGLNDIQLIFTKKDGFILDNYKDKKRADNKPSRYFNHTMASAPGTDTIKIQANNNDSLGLNNSFIKFSNNDNSNNYTDDQESKLTEEEKTLQENGKLNKRVENDPYNIDAWVDLVEYQDRFMKFSARKSRARGPLLEKKMAIYRKALLSNPDSDVLIINYLQLASQLWQSDQVQQLWEKVIQKNTSDFLEKDSRLVIISESIWNAYIQFCVSNFTQFTVASMRNTMVSLIRKLLIKRRMFRPRDQAFMEKVKTVEEYILMFISQWLRFERQAGYSERALGIYQAMIEFNCFFPQQFAHETHATLLKNFKLFWDSDCPRVGEMDAIGWTQSIVQKRVNLNSSHDDLSIEEIERLLKEEEEKESLLAIVDQSFLKFNSNNGDEQQQDDKEEGEEGEEEQDQDDQDDNQDINDQDINQETVDTSNNNDNILKYSRWGVNETLLDESFWMPMKINDMDTTTTTNTNNIKYNQEEDPDRVVLFDDFKDILLRLIREEDKLELIFQFLEFLGFPIMISEKIPSRYPFNHLLRRESINNIQNNNIYLLFDNLDKSKFSNNSTDNSNSSQQTPQQQPNWIKAFDNMINNEKMSSDKIQFIERVFEQCLTHFKSTSLSIKETLMVSYVLFKSTYDIESAKNTCKSLLAQNRNHLLLYDIFAYIEYKQNKLQDSKKIYQTTLNILQQQQQSNNSNHNIDYIYKEYILLELNIIYSTIQKDPSILKKFIQLKKGTLLDLFAVPIHLLCCFVEQSYTPYTTKNNYVPLDKNRLLLCKSKYQRHSNSFSSSSNSSSIDYILNHCIFDLLIDGYDQSFSTFKQYINDAKHIYTVGSIVHEQLLIQYVEIVTKIAPILNTPPHKIKSLAYDSLLQYYDHPKLLSLFLNYEGYSQLLNRVRDYFDFNIHQKHSNNNGSNSNSDSDSQQQPQPLSTIYCLFAIRFEIYRLGSASRLKSIFEKSIQLSTCKHNPILWRLYILFELYRGKSKSSKSLYYKSIKQLPFSKEIWLLPFTNQSFTKLFTTAELNDIVTLLNEKEIRIRLKIN